MFDFDFDDFNDAVDLAGVFQRAQQHRTQQETLEALNHIRSQIAKQDAMPKCPICGGRLGGNAVQKCMHCNVEVEWVSGRPYDSERARSARDRLARQQQEQVGRQKLAMELIQKAIPVMERAIVLDVVDMNHLIGPVVAIFGAAGIEAPIDFSIHIERPQPSSGCLGMLLMPALWLLRAT